MNKHVHRLVFDRKRGMRVPAAEHVRSAGKAGGGQTRAVVVACAALMAALGAAGEADARTLGNMVPRASMAWQNRTVPDAAKFPSANPNLPFRSGQYNGLDQGNFSLNYATDGLTINQTDKNIIVNWDSFNIGRGYTVTFVQPTKGAALNKIWDTKASVILGQIKANGEVILENTNGILFGPTARVDTQRFVATALSLANETFLKGIRNSAVTTPIFGSDADTPDGSVVVERGAEIKALAGGDVMLIAPKVYNEGRIETPGGQTVMAAGQKVYLMASPDPAQRGLMVAVDAFKAPTGDAAPLPEGTNTVEQAEAGTYLVDKDGNTTTQADYKGLEPLIAKINAVVAEKGTINLVGMSIRQNGVLTATTAVKGQNGAIYLHAGASKRDVQTPSNGTMPLQDAAGNPIYGVASQELGAIEFGAKSVTAVDPDASTSATQKDADVYYRSRIDVLGSDIWVRSGATLRANSGDISLQAAKNKTQDALPLEADARKSEADGVTNVSDGSRILVEDGALIDVSGLRDVALPMSRNQTSGRLFKIELADAPVQRNGVLYRQNVQFDASDSVNVANTTGLYNSIERSASELSTLGGNVRIEGLGDVAVVNGAKVNIGGGSVHYGSGVIHTSVLRTGNTLVTLDKAQAGVQYDELVDSSLGNRTVLGYDQGFDAGTALISGIGHTYTGLSGFKADVIVGAKQRNGLLVTSYTDVRNGAARVKPKTLDTGLPTHQTPVKVSDHPEQAAMARPLGGLIQIGKVDSANKRAFTMPAISVTPARSKDLGPLPEQASPQADAFFASLPTVTSVSSAELGQTGAAQVALLADLVDVKTGVSLNLGASGQLSINTNKDLLFAGQFKAEGGVVSLTSNDGDVELAEGSRIDLSGRRLDERGVTAGLEGLSVDGGSLSLSAGRSVLLDAGSTVDVSAGVWRQSLVADTKGVAGKVDIQINTTDVTVPVLVGDTLTNVYGYDGKLSLNGALRGYDFSKGGTLSIAGLRTLVIGGEASNGGLALAPEFFSDKGFGTFALSAAGDVVVKAGTDLTPTLKNLVVVPAAGHASPDKLVRTETLEAGLRQGVSLSLTAAEGPPALGKIVKNGLEKGGSVVVEDKAVVNAGIGGAINLKAAYGVDVAGSLVARGGAVSLSISGERGSTFTEAQADSAGDASGYVDDQLIRLRSTSKIDVSGATRSVTLANGRVSGEVLGGGSVKLNDNGQTRAVRGRVITEADSVIDVSGTSGSLSLGRGVLTTAISKGAGSVSIGSTDGFLLEGSMVANRPDASVGGGQFVASMSREGAGDVTKSGGNAYTATERAIVVEANAASVATHRGDFLGQGVLSASMLNESGFDRVELRADDRVVLRQGASLVAAADKAPLRSVSLNSRVIEMAGEGQHAIQAAYVALGDRNLAPQHGETHFVSPASSAGEGSFNVRAGLIEVFGFSALRGTADTMLSATLAADNVSQSRRDGEVRFIGRSFTLESSETNQHDLSGGLNFDGQLTLEAGQVYASTLSTFTVQGQPGATEGVANSRLTVNGPSAGPSTSQTPLSALASLSLQAHDIEVNGTIRQPFGSITINGETSPVLGEGSLLSVSGKGTAVPVGTTLNQRTWVYATGGVQGEDGVLTTDPTVKTMTGLGVAKSITVEGAGLTIDARSQIDAQGGGDIVASEFIAGVGGSKDTTARKDVFAILPNYTYDFAPYDTQISASTKQVGTSLTAGDQIEITTSNAVLSKGRYTLLPASYSVLPGAVLVSQTTLGSGTSLRQAISQDDGSVIVSGSRSAVGTSINGGRDTRQAWVLEPESTFRAKSEIALTSINSLLGQNAKGSVSRPGDAGRVSLVSTDSAFNWSADYKLNGVQGFSGGQLDIVMPTMSVEAATGEQPTAGVVTVAALKASGADSIVLGGKREGTAEETVVASKASTVTIKTDVDVKGELMVVATDAVEVVDQVTIRSTGEVSQDVNKVTMAGEGVALMVSNRLLTDVSRDLTGVDVRSEDKALTLGKGVTLAGASTQLDSSAKVVRGEGLTLSTSALGVGGQRVAIGGDAGDANALVLDSGTLSGVSRLQVRGYDGIDLVGGVKVGAMDLSGQPLMNEVVLDSRLVRGVATSADAQTALVQARHVTLRNTSGLAADLNAIGDTSLTVMSMPAVADATAEGVTIGPGAQRLAFNKAELASTGDVVLRGQGSLSAQGDLLLNGARLTAAAKAKSSIDSDKTLSVLAIDDSNKADKTARVAVKRTLGDVVGAGATVALSGQRVVQDGLIDLPSGQLDITGRGQADSRDTVVFETGSSTKAAGWVAKAGDAWSAVASAGHITATAQQGDIVLKGTLDVSAPVSTTVGVASGAAGTVTLLATQASVKEVLDGQTVTTTPAGAVVLGDTARILGAADKAGASGILRVDAGRLVTEAERAKTSEEARSALSSLVKLANDGGFHREMDLRVREGNQTLSTALTAARVLISADSGTLTLENGATIDARSARGGVVQLSAQQDVTLQSGASIDASSSAQGANGGDVLIASSKGYVDLQSGASVSAGGDDSADGRIVLRAQTENGHLKINKPEAALSAGEVTAEVVKVFSDTKTVSMTDTSKLMVGGQDVVAYLKGITQGTMDAYKADLGWTGGNYHVRSGVEIQTGGDFNLNKDWSLSTIRPGQEPIFLTVRAKGNVNLNGSLSDGFASATRATDTATAPTALLAGDGASYRLVAGADLQSANTLKTDMSAGSGNLTVAAGKMVRTTSGSIELAAAQDVVLKAGTGSAPVQGVVYVAGKVSATPVNRAGKPTSSWEQFTGQGGRLEVNAGRDVVSPAASQLFNNWFLHTGANAASVTWWTAFDSFKQGLGSMGGGNVRVVAGRDIANLAVVAPTTGRTVQGTEPGQFSQLTENGGDVLVRAGRDINGGEYLIGRGQGTIEASGDIRAGDSLNEAVMPKAGLLLGVMDGQWAVRSNGDVAIAAAFNPTSVESQSKRSTSGSYFTYSNDAAVSVSSSAGDITWGVSGGLSLGNGLLNLNKTYTSATSNERIIFPASGASAQLDALLQVGPASLSLAAFGGNVAVGSLALFPSVTGNLTVFGGQDVTLAAQNTNKTLLLSGVDTAAWDAYTVKRPALATTSTTKIGLLLSAGGLSKSKTTATVAVAERNLHQDDLVPVRIHAGRDLTFSNGATLDLAKSAHISAGGDIVSPNVLVQQFRSTDITRIVAGGDVIGAENQPAPERNQGLIQVSGPGELQVQAGRNLDLSTSAGIETVGNQFNPSLPAESASVRVSAGMNRSVNVPVFADTFLSNDPQARGQLVTYVAKMLSLNEASLSYDQALVYFAQLTPAHQVDFAERVVTDRFVANYVASTGMDSAADQVWRFLANQAGVATADTSSALYQDYTGAQRALVSYVEGVQGVSGLSFSDALTRYRAMDDATKASLIDKKKNLSATMVAAFLVATEAAPYAQLWQDRVKAAAKALPEGAIAPAIDDYQSALFKQFKDDVTMAELKRLGSAASGVADSSNALYNDRRKAVRDQFWALASQTAGLAAIGPEFKSTGDINVAGSKVFTSGAGDFEHGGIDLFAPGGQVIVGYSGQSDMDRAQAATRGLVTNGGNIRSYSNGDFQVNSQKAFVIGKGDLLVYSANGNIDSGRGSNTDVAVPPAQVKRSLTGEVYLYTPPPISGSGIGIVRAANGSFDGKVSLLAPKGEVRALDAYIQGPEVIVPGKVLGADNLQGSVKGQAAAPTVSVALSINTGLGAETAAGETKDEAIKRSEKKRDAASLLTVDLLGMGDGGEAPAPAAGRRDCEKDKKQQGCADK